MALEIIIILSLIQGITEFLPISSSAHLIIIPEFFSNIDSSRGFDVSLHFGSLLAVIYYLKKDLMKIISDTINFKIDNEGFIILKNLIISTTPIIILGFLVHINNFNLINLKAFPHINIGLFAFQDTDGNGEFSRDFKGQPLEPFGFSLNPNLNFEDVVFENIVFDMTKFQQLEIRLK